MFCYNFFKIKNIHGLDTVAPPHSSPYFCRYSMAFGCRCEPSMTIEWGELDICMWPEINLWVFLLCYSGESLKVCPFVCWIKVGKPRLVVCRNHSQWEHEVTEKVFYIFIASVLTEPSPTLLNRTTSQIKLQLNDLHSPLKQYLCCLLCVGKALEDIELVISWNVLQRLR